MIKIRLAHRDARTIVMGLLLIHSYLQIHLLSKTKVEHHAASHSKETFTGKIPKSPPMGSTMRRILYPDDGFPNGILSGVTEESLRSLQREIDDQNPTERCKRYGFVYNTTAPKQRRIFYGANINDEPWELFEIVAAEAYDILEGMVFVEANRTINFDPRPFRRLSHESTLRRLFSARQLQIRTFVNENERLGDRERENLQRDEIIKGWKEMGMTPEDVGFVSDPDEIFSRDFLRAVQVCDGIDAFDYELHRCGRAAKLLSSTRVFEMTPECTYDNRNWHHPDMVMGACIETIGDETLNPVAPRNGLARKAGFGRSCVQMVNETDLRYPLWTAYDFIFVCGDQLKLNDKPNYDIYTGYRFHNFNMNFSEMRLSQFSYEHPDPTVFVKPLEEFSHDIKFAVRCIKNVTEDSTDREKRVAGGFEAVKPNLPLYFRDKEYRQQKHAALQKMVEEDEIERLSATDNRIENWPFLSDGTDGERIAHVPSMGLDEETVVIPDDGFPKGILSDIPIARLRSLQRAVDEHDNTERCRRYGFFYNSDAPKSRKIFYGANIADEPWELLTIVAAEAFGIFEGMVYVEANRTHNFDPRPFKRLHHNDTIRSLFGARQVQVRGFVNENRRIREIYRDNMQRNEIVRGWKELGMTPDDIGYIADPDETFSRDFLRAVQVCDGIDAFNYDLHRCGKAAKLVSSTRVFEMTPECTAYNRNWYHPDMMLGACIEQIGNESLNPISQRNGVIRSAGYGNSCVKMISEKDQRYPLWTPYDFKLLCGGDQAKSVDLRNYEFYTGYHFHNFFSDFNATRFKYFSYAHPVPRALERPLEELSDDVKFAVRCIKNMTEDPSDRYKRVLGGFEAIRPTLPLYFLDNDYRRRRHGYMKEKVDADEKQRLLPKEKAIFKHDVVQKSTWPFLSEPHVGGGSVDSTPMALSTEAVAYPHDGFPKGILSNATVARLRELQRAVDDQDHTERCRRFGFFYNSSAPKRRRIFYGSNIADEPWELLEIVAAEAFGIFEGMVYVEANRSHHFSPRPFKRLNHVESLRLLFGARQVEVRAFVNEEERKKDLERDNMQRNEILKGWKEMGMMPDDIGYIADADETFSRDFLRAAQVCDGIESFDYEVHRCGKAAKLVSSTRVFEMTPECTPVDRNWHHPDMLIGACIEMIGNETLNPLAPRNGLGRSGGFGDTCVKMISEEDPRYPLWTPYDFKLLCGGDQVTLIDQPSYDHHTGYHFHNFFSDFNVTRFKYFSYAHPDPDALDKPLEELSEDVKFAVRCIKNMTETDSDRYRRVEGGFEGLRPTLPLYFIDKEYRHQRHTFMKQKVEADEKERTAKSKVLLLQQKFNKRSWPFLTESRSEDVPIVYLPEEVVVYPDDGFPRGILSNVSVSRLRSLQQAVDQQDHAERCKRYGFFYNSSAPKRRRIFYGASIADEPWELLEIVAAEAFGIFEAMVYVEANRTQDFVARPFRRLDHDGALRSLFGASQVQVRSFVNEKRRVRDLERDNLQRYEILNGWKEMGMKPDDVGYVADPDETFSRDFLRAVQVCDGIEAFDYEAHRCNRKAKLVSSTRVFEMTPECTTDKRNWHHPDMLLGACIEQIGNEKLNPVAPRNGVVRVPGFGLPGFGNNCVQMISETDRRYPLWTPYDFKLLCGGDQEKLIDQPNYAYYTGYHFHNFFSDFNATRFKYFSYAHPDPHALEKPLEELSEDVKFAVRCLKGTTEDSGGTKFRMVEGGFENLKPALPLYFLDKQYRQHRHSYMQGRVEADEMGIKSSSKRID